MIQEFSFLNRKFKDLNSWRNLALAFCSCLRLYHQGWPMQSVPFPLSPCSSPCSRLPPVKCVIPVHRRILSILLGPLLDRKSHPRAYLYMCHRRIFTRSMAGYTSPMRPGHLMNSSTQLLTPRSDSASECCASTRSVPCLCSFRRVSWLVLFAVPITGFGGITLLN